MPTFDTPQPIVLSLELGVAHVRVVASDRADTVVDVRPGDPAKKADVAAAQQTRVEYANGTVLVHSPKGWRKWTPWGPWGGSESIDVLVEVPTGSAVRGLAGVGDLRCTGRIGECWFRTGAGDVSLEHAGAVVLRAGVGDVTVDAIDGRAEIKTAGAVRIGSIEGPAVIRNSNGDTWVGEVAGEARVHAANGAISVDLARAGISAKTANGAIRLGEVARGPAVAQSASGTVEVGVPDGVPAWLELETKFGHVLNDLDDAGRPAPGEEPVEIRAHTSAGDIAIHRSFASGGGTEEP